MQKKYIEVLQQITEALVEDISAIEITSKVDDMGVLVLLKVGPTDTGKVVGAGGKMAEAIRTILRSVGRAEGARVSLKILEPDGSDRSQTGQA